MDVNLDLSLVLAKDLQSKPTDGPLAASPSESAPMTPLAGAEAELPNAKAEPPDAKAEPPDAEPPENIAASASRDSLAAIEGTVASSTTVDEKFTQLLEAVSVDILRLKRLSWKGIPAQHRPLVWKILTGYLPNLTGRHAAILERKHSEYREIVKEHFGEDARRDASIMHQITLDVPRTAPDVPLFRNAVVREALARILYCWSIRRPASGYVQGINDLVTPFYQVFISEHLRDETVADDAPSSSTLRVTLSEEDLFRVEADSFWCLTRLLDSIQDHYTFSQSGITRQLTKIRQVLQCTDPKLLAHLESQGVSLIQFAFRWINCLLMREFPLHMIIRMWDTYLSEDDGAGFADFHIYVCAAFLSKWSSQLELLEFQDIIIFLQNLPTASWEMADIEMLLSEAFVWKTLFKDSKGGL